MCRSHSPRLIPPKEQQLNQVCFWTCLFCTFQWDRIIQHLAVYDWFFDLTCFKYSSLSHVWVLHSFGNWIINYCTAIHFDYICPLKTLFIWEVSMHTKKWDQSERVGFLLPPWGLSSNSGLLQTHYVSEEDLELLTLLPLSPGHTRLWGSASR